MSPIWHHVTKVYYFIPKQIKLPGFPEKVLPFEKLPKFGYQAFSKLSLLILFVNGPKIFGDCKIWRLQNLEIAKSFAI